MGPNGQPMKSPSLVTTALLTVSILFPILASAAVVVRIWCLRLKSQSLKGDDGAIIFALVRISSNSRDRETMGAKLMMTLFSLCFGDKASMSLLQLAKPASIPPHCLHWKPLLYLPKSVDRQYWIRIVEMLNAS